MHSPRSASAFALVLFASTATASFVACQSEEQAPRLTNPEDARPDATTDTGGTSKPDSATEASDAELDATGLDGAASDAPVDDANDGSTFDGPMESSAEAASDAKVCLPALTTSTPGACSSVVQSWTDEGAFHFSPGTALGYCTKPPSSGDHYDVWAAYRTYDKPVPYGYLVHSLEHGAVILLYKCASGSCPTVQAQLQAVANARPVDSTCTAPVQRRIIIAPDPTLDVEIGAAAWGWTYRASCVDATSLGQFIDDHYAKATENLCADGVTPP